MNERLVRYANQCSIFPEEQYGFREDRDCRDMIFVANQLMEKLKSLVDSDLFLMFLDFKKAYDSVNREMLWKILQSFRVPQKLIEVCRLLYRKSTAKVNINKCISDEFEIEVGLKQGDVMAPTLFNYVIAEFCNQLDKEKENHRKNGEDEGGVKIETEFESNPFIKKSKSKEQGKCETNISRGFFADDGLFVEKSRQNMERTMYDVITVAKNLGLTVSTSKTVFMHCHSKSNSVSDADPINVVVENESYVFKSVKEFVYLGNLLSMNPHCNDALDYRMKIANGRLATLMRCLGSYKGVLVESKMILFKSLVLSAFMYGSSTWTTSSKNIDNIKAWYTTSLRRLLNVNQAKAHWSNISLLEKCDTYNLDITLRYYRLKWFHKIVTMSEDRLAKKLLFGQICGSKKRGQSKSFLKCIKEDLELFGISYKDWNLITSSQFLEEVEIGKQNLIDKVMKDEKHRRQEVVKNRIQDILLNDILVRTISKVEERQKENQVDHNTYIIDFIVKRKIQKGVEKWRIHWKGYPKSDRSWVLTEDLVNCDIEELRREFPL